ncbi:putative serine/threonine-protein kinase At1g01540 isoform X2 [Tasmannia lanceolata]
MVIGFVWLCMLQRKRLLHKNSETGSSDPSALVAGPSQSESQGVRQYTLEELEQATKNFSESNRIGGGTFGLVYKGLLRDGTVVAIKRRRGPPRQEFVEEVHYLSEIQHRHLVTLLGYCQEDGLQMLVFEYLPNGSICSHLYDTGQDIETNLEFKQRLSIAIGAAKGLCHLHGLTPTLVHKDFKTNNVLVDENFIAKVADGGIFKLLERIEDAGPSIRMAGSNVFQDPEIEDSEILSEVSDVYSFGVFLLELVTGQEASRFSFSGSGESLTQWVESHGRSNDLVDRRLGGSYTSEGMKDLIGLTIRCLNLTGKRRPKMDVVVSELDRIIDKERTLTTVMGEGTSTFKLGSQLFTTG